MLNMKMQLLCIKDPPEGRARERESERVPVRPGEEREHKSGRVTEREKSERTQVTVKV